ncbi:D-sedoheptulose-7-phosphate isomerase [Azospirillum doebereinerae]|uniref:Phosphoheptose isomerase n=1 Tax=Azospirillum doebereinerae TaxID=92933 RepID=A0A3S0VHB3_9PROT|nr:SIS domain-containing protein [Azospirillum doebereinerae]MCG5238927.1 SIS domain-containing protein [Azospirillum doebereinerae]RUQ68945.1 SIS domain-containing protein [Azospirillum doebereinerae]
MSQATSVNQSFSDYVGSSIDVLRNTAETLGMGRLDAAIAAVATALGENRALLVCGNGGSASDAQHITGELVGRFLKERRGLKAICLSSNAAVLTAWANDYSYDTVFSRQVEAYGETGGVLLGISTSGNSKNVVAAFEQARAMGMITIALTGEGGGRLAALSDILLDVPSRSTPLIQQAHICLYHHLCERVETQLAG